MSGLRILALSVLLCGAAAHDAFASEFSNNRQDIIVEKNENLSGNVNNPPESAVGGDAIDSATVIIGLPYADGGNTCAFTNDYDEACPYTGSTSPDVVYSYSPSSNQKVTFDLCNSAYDTKVYVYENAAGNLVACNDDACNDPAGNPFRSRVTCVDLTAGNTYYVIIDGYFGDCGSYNLSVYLSVGCPGVCDPENCPPGAAFEGEPVCGPNYIDSFNGGCNSIPPVFSPIDCGETVCGAGGNYTFKGLSYRDTDWYQLNLPEATEVTITVCASFEVQLAAIDGNVGCDFITIICGSVFGPPGSTVSCTYLAPAGLNWIFVSTSGFAGVPCGSPYFLSVWPDCRPPVINEVAFFPDEADTSEDAQHEWVELFNPGPTDSLRGWTLSNRSGLQAATLPSWAVMPESSFLVVHFSDGEQDSNFTDGAGAFYAGDADIFSEELDECALYRGVPGDSTISDFVAWAVDDAYVPGQAHAYATSAAIWPAQAFFSTTEAFAPSDNKRRVVLRGTSIARDSMGTDGNTPSDWDFDGGKEGLGRTSGKKNSTPLEIVIGTPLPRQPTKNWTLMGYFCADDDALEEAIYNSMNLLESGGSRNEMNVVVLFDGNKLVHEQGNRGSLGNSWRGYLDLSITGAHIVTFRPLAGDAPNRGELNMGDPATLTEFVTWAIAALPAKHYALIFNGHGAGWKGVVPDETNNDRLQMGELSGALAAAGLTDSLDIIGFDACLMSQLEVARQVSGYGNIMVASEELVPGYGWPYNKILELVTRASVNGTPITASKLAEWMVGEYNAFYGQDHVSLNASQDRCRTMSAFRLNEPSFSALMGQFGELATVLRASVSDVQKHGNPADNVQELLRGKRNKAECFFYQDYVDLQDFCELIKNDAKLPMALQAKAGAAIAAIGGARIREEHGAGHQKAHGLSVYFPECQTSGCGVRPSCYPYPRHEPFDAPSGARRTDGASPRVKYAGDPDDCKPPDVPCVDHSADARNHPRENAPDFKLAELTEWDEFLHRYYEPVADAGENRTVRVGQAVAFSGKGSSDVDDMIRKLCWDFDGNVDSPAPNDCVADDWDQDCVDDLDDDCDAEPPTLDGVVMHTFTAPGTYKVTLTVLDKHDQEHPGHHEAHQASANISVLPAAFIEGVSDDAVGDSAGVLGRANQVPIMLALRVVGTNPHRIGDPVEFAYSIPEPGAVVSIGVFDVAGRRVAMLKNGYAGAGVHSGAWIGPDPDGSQGGSGRYFLRLESDGNVLSRKIVVMK